MQIRRTLVFSKWLNALTDRRARAKLQQRIDRLEEGNPGDVKGVGAGIMEMRLDYGPGYRVYYMQRGMELVILLCGGDKSTQQRDIDRAKLLAAQLDQGELQ